MFKSLDPLYLGPSGSMMEESKLLRDDAQLISPDTTDNFTRTYEPIRGTSDSLGLERFTATGQPYVTSLPSQSAR